MLLHLQCAIDWYLTRSSPSSSKMWAQHSLGFPLMILTLWNEKYNPEWQWIQSEPSPVLYKSSVEPNADRLCSWSVSSLLILLSSFINNTFKHTSTTILYTQVFRRERERDMKPAKTLNGKLLKCTSAHIPVKPKYWQVWARNRSKPTNLKLVNVIRAAE